ncbi:hypothetical protein FOWG_17420 [Fusarium oxysporum f. sp. lycopersici MN25]|nr:hypothetical protein FOWG_17420 [Fusarium oxysporum f. sp. lycopersici MN25]
MKCVGSDPASATCDRCQRLRRQCVYESHRRGLWRRDQTGRREERARPADEHIEELPSTSGPAASHHLLPGPTVQSADPVPNFQTSSFQSRASESVSASSRSDQSPFAPASFVTNSQDTRGLSLAAALDPDRSVDREPRSHLDELPQSNQETADMPRKDDPIDMGLISRPSAQYLYEGFFKHFNCLVGLLDPNLYTFSYTRSRSSLLFTMVLTISSRIFQPESHYLIRNHTEFLLGRVLLACDSEVENIWAIICMYHWKDANDTRGYMLIGFALRMAVSAEWNMTRRSVSYNTEGLQDPTELQVRQRRDKDRVWLALGNIDRTSSYFTDRPLTTIVVLDHVASRHWLTLTAWTYPLGDGKAVGGHELTGIACSVYESMMKTRVDPDSDTSLSTLDFETFQKDMEEFNTKIIAWGDYWRPVFATFPDPEPFQTPLIYLFRDYMRLYFNSVFLHRMLVYERRSSQTDQIARTTRICYSSALGVLQQTIEMGEMDTIYYLWDTAHLMIAYSSMMIPKLLRQTVDEPAISRTEALNVLTQVTTTYAIAAKSMGNPEPRVLESRMENTGATNAVSVQAHLLSAILARLKADVSLAENDLTTQSMSSIPSGTSLSWIEDQLNRSTLFSDGRMEPQQAEYIDLGVPTASHPHDIGSLTPQMNEGLDLMLDNDFINSRYFDVGLSSWDEPGIFIRPH